MEFTTPGNNLPGKDDSSGGLLGKGAEVQTATPAVDHAAALGHEAVDSVAAAVKPAEEWINEKTDALLAAPRNALSESREYVAANPLQSMGVALAVGFLLGRWAR
jgi:ElaB/YqjD/DUF883 family membrane-anchored ribosome-binding protein